MADSSLRSLERAVAADPREWRPLLAAMRRAGRGPEALAMLEAVEERLVDEGRGLTAGAQNEAICGATTRPVTAALYTHFADVLAVSDARIALENDLALRRGA